jgi:hypothetical protein
MRKARFTEEQIVATMREADRYPVSAIVQPARYQRANDPRVAQAFGRVLRERRPMREAALDAKLARPKKLDRQGLRCIRTGIVVANITS